MDAMVEYNLRPRSSRPRTAKLDSRAATSDRRKKEKQSIKVRPAPLSKYRRKTANARERTRMQEINAAFERLQQVVPSFPVASSQEDFSDSSTSTSGNKQLTKITTLRLAMNYIRALSAILEEDKHSTDAEIAARCPPASPPNCDDFDTIDDLMNMPTPSPVLDHDPMLLCECTDDDIQVDRPTVQAQDTQLEAQGLLSPTDPNCHFDFLLTPDDT